MVTGTDEVVIALAESVVNKVRDVID